LTPSGVINKPSAATLIGTWIAMLPITAVTINKTATLSSSQEAGLTKRAPRSRRSGDEMRAKASLRNKPVSAAAGGAGFSVVKMAFEFK